MTYQNRHTNVAVTLTSESDGYGDNFGLEYWQVSSVDKPWDYIGSSPYSMNRRAIEQSPDWIKIE